MVRSAVRISYGAFCIWAFWCLMTQETRTRLSTTMQLGSLLVCRLRNFMNIYTAFFFLFPFRQLVVNDVWRSWFAAACSLFISSLLVFLHTICPSIWPSSSAFPLIGLLILVVGHLPFACYMAGTGTCIFCMVFPIIILLLTISVVNNFLSHFFYNVLTFRSIRDTSIKNKYTNLFVQHLLPASFRLVTINYLAYPHSCFDLMCTCITDKLWVANEVLFVQAYRPPRVGHTYISEGFSEWAPHQSVYDGIEAGVETAEQGQPMHELGRSCISANNANIHQKHGGLDWRAAQREYGHDCQTGECHSNWDGAGWWRHWTGSAGARHYLSHIGMTTTSTHWSAIRESRPILI